MAILKGNQKKITQQIVRYFTETTGQPYDVFLNEAMNTTAVGSSTEGLQYYQWLAKESLKLLNMNGISLADCIENKDVLRASMQDTAEESREEGEFYTPEIWASYCREDLKRICIEKGIWGKAVIWDASCGTGNLLRSLEDYPLELVYQSTLNEDDAEVVRSVWAERGLPQENVFTLDFLNKIDWDEYNTEFVNQLPQGLQHAIRNNEPIIFFMNPPYKIGEAVRSDVGSHMKSHGMSKSALDIYHHFIYRIMLLKDVFSHENIYISLIGPTTIFQSDTIKELYDELKSDHLFHSGIAFDINEFSNIKGGTGWMVSHTTWCPKREGDPDTVRMILTTKVGKDGQIVDAGSRPYDTVEQSLHYWTAPVEAFPRLVSVLPIVTTFKDFSGLGKHKEGVLGYLMSSPHVIRGTRRTAVTTLPNGDNMPITEENFWRCVSSFSARRCYAVNANSFDNSQYWSAPDETKEGYQQWLYDSLALFIFDNASCQTAYRPLVYDKNDVHINQNIQNRLFPLPKEVVISNTVDPLILKDLEENPTDNSFLLAQIAATYDMWSQEAKDLYNFGVALILHSLKEGVRASVGYDNWTVAWDAGLCQLRNTEKDGQYIIPRDLDAQYLKLVQALKAKLKYGVYEYGFMYQSLT